MTYQTSSTLQNKVSYCLLFTGDYTETKRGECPKLYNEIINNINFICALVSSIGTNYFFVYYRYSISYCQRLMLKNRNVDSTLQYLQPQWLCEWQKQDDNTIGVPMSINWLWLQQTYPLHGEFTRTQVIKGLLHGNVTTTSNYNTKFPPENNKIPKC